jgi:hypothetical protein
MKIAGVYAALRQLSLFSWSGLRSGASEGQRERDGDD